MNKTVKKSKPIRRISPSGLALSAGTAAGALLMLGLALLAAFSG